LLKEQHSRQENGDGAACLHEGQEPRSVELEVPAESGGGPAMVLQDSDSELEETDKHEFITDAMGWNVSRGDKL
jgi:hypothetical protein